MTVTDTLARIDYVLMAESNAAGAEWLLEEFDRKWLRFDAYGEPLETVYVRPMIELIDDHDEYCECHLDDSGWGFGKHAARFRGSANGNVPQPTEGA